MGACGSHPSRMSTSVVPSAKVDKRLKKSPSGRSIRSERSEGRTETKSWVSDVEEEELPLSIESILHDMRLSKHFARYLQHQLSTGKDKVRTNLAMNSLLFCFDVQDYAVIPPSPLKKIQAMDILSAYIDSGSKKCLQFNNYDIQKLAYLKEMDERLLPDMAFDRVRDQAIENIKPALRGYFCSNGSRGYNSMKKNRRISALAPIVGDGPGAGNSITGEYFAQELRLRSILKSPASCRAFQKFLANRRDNPIDKMFFVIDVLEYKEACDLFSTPNSQSSHNDEESQYLYKNVHKLYRKYVKLESVEKLDLSSSTIGIIRDQVNEGRIKKEIFDGALVQTVRALIRDHLGAFLDSPEYESMILQESMLGERKETRRANRYDLEDNKSIKLNKKGAPVNSPPLKAVITGPFVHYFQKFLRVEGKQAFLLFWIEAEEFKRLPHTQLKYINNQAQKIFNKFIRRGCPMELEIEAKLRHTIMKNLMQPDEHVYDIAQKEVYCILENEYYGEFIHDKMFGDMMQAWGSSDEGRASEKRRKTPSKVETTVTLREVLNEQEWAALFRKFLLSENCSPPLNLWMEIEHIRGLPKSDYLTNQSRKLYSRYIGMNAREKVGISLRTLQEVEQGMKNPSPVTFLMVQEEMFEFMNEKLFPKFLTSEYFQLLGKKGRKTQPKNEPMTLRKMMIRRQQEQKEEQMQQQLVIQDPMQMKVKNFLQDQERRKYFLAYCEERRCQENIYFWIECEDFKYIPSEDFMSVTANKIFRKYIVPQAKLQVNISSKTVKNISDNMQHPTRGLFLKAQTEVEKLMEVDSFSKFKKSPHMDEYRKQKNV